MCNFFPPSTIPTRAPPTTTRNRLAIAEEGERLGFTHARTVEHYFNRYGGYSPNPIVFLSAVSQRTKTMRLVTGAVLPVFNHPFKLAGEIAMLDGISGGRLDVGFARAFLPHEFRRFGISPDESQARFREGLEQIELLLTQENATHQGQFHSFENVTSLPRPTQKPRPKFYIAATQTPELFEFAGRKGYSLMAIPIGPIGGLIDLYRKSWREAGHPGDGEVMVAFHMFCHEDAQAGARHRAAAVRGVFPRAQRGGRRLGARHLQGLSRLRHVDAAAALVHARRPDRVGRRLGRHARRDQGDHPPVVGSIGKFEHASLQINFGTIDAARGAEVHAAVRPRGDAGICRITRRRESRQLAQAK